MDFPNRVEKDYRAAVLAACEGDESAVDWAALREPCLMSGRRAGNASSDVAVYYQRRNAASKLREADVMTAAIQQADTEAAGCVPTEAERATLKAADAIRERLATTRAAAVARADSLKAQQRKLRTSALRFLASTCDAELADEIGRLQGERQNLENLVANAKPTLGDDVARARLRLAALAGEVAALEESKKDPRRLRWSRPAGGEIPVEPVFREVELVDAEPRFGRLPPLRA